MDDVTTDTSAGQRALDAFLVDNRELEQLDARLSAFNLFNVLRVDKVEIRHSNVLAWLLAPDESHGLGPTFLRRFLSRLLMEHDGAAALLSPAQVELMSFSDVEVLREWQNIDILVHSRANRWCLLIENKIKSKESRGQLVRYLDRVRQEMPDYQIIPVFLTLEGDDPSDEAVKAGYVSWSHAQVLDLAEQIVTQHRSRIPDDARVLLDHYLVTLRRLTMQDQELIDLCKAIYRKHRDAINLIVEYGTASNVLDAMLVEIESQTKCEFCKAYGSSVWFLPEPMSRHVPTQELNGWGFLPRGVAVMCWVRYIAKRQQYVMVMEVGPMADAQKRICLLEAIQAASFSFWEGGLRKKAKFTRIVSLKQKPKRDDYGEPDLSDDAVRRVVGSLWKKMWKEGEKIVDVLAAFDWS